MSITIISSIYPNKNPLKSISNLKQFSSNPTNTTNTGNICNNIIIFITRLMILNAIFILF